MNGVTKGRERRREEEEGAILVCARQEIFPGPKKIARDDDDSVFVFVGAATHAFTMRRRPTCTAAAELVLLLCVLHGSFLRSRLHYQGQISLSLLLGPPNFTFPALRGKNPSARINFVCARAL